MAETLIGQARLRRCRRRPPRLRTSATACSTPVAVRGAVATERNTRYISSKSSTIKATRRNNSVANPTGQAHRAQRVDHNPTHNSTLIWRPSNRRSVSGPQAVLVRQLVAKLLAQLSNLVRSLHQAATWPQAMATLTADSENISLPYQMNGHF